jgi:ATP-dependent Zn protease
MITIDAVAHHEAGHAVAAAVLGVPFDYATIQGNREKNTLGHTMFAPPPITMRGGDQWSEILDELTEDRDSRSRIICALVGRRAEEKFLGAKVESGFAGDYRIVLRLFRCMGVRNQDGRLYRELDGEATRLVATHWPEVTAVAKGLMDKERLSANEVKGIVGKIQESGSRVTA